MLLSCNTLLSMRSDGRDKLTKPNDDELVCHQAENSQGLSRSACMMIPVQLRTISATCIFKHVVARPQFSCTAGRTNPIRRG